MATVTVSFTPLPAHVRTARFIAASVARRAGVAETVLDEIRLAVSEACSLAVRFHLAQAPAVPVEIRLTETAEHFRIEVVDAVARAAPQLDDGMVIDLDADDVDDVADVDHANGGADANGGALSAESMGEIGLRGQERIGLAVISGLVDDVSVAYLDDRSVVTMTWPIG